MQNQDECSTSGRQIERMLFFCLRKLWQLFAVGLVLLAVLISLLKYSLPYANQYKSHFETLIQDKFDVELNIESISAGWQGNGPSLLLKGISFNAKDLSPVELKIEETRLHVNIWQSLLKQKLISSYFVLDGVTTTVDMPKLLAHSEQQDIENKVAQLDLVEGLFFGQIGHFALENSLLKIKMFNNTQRIIQIQQLSWQNKGEKHQGQGEIRLPGITDNSLNVILDLYGSEYAQAFGELYVDADNLNITPWLSSFIAEDITQVNSDVNFELWARIDHGTFKNIQLNWQPSSFSWKFDQNVAGININSGALRFQPDEKGWKLQSSNLVLGDDQQSWPPVKFTVLNEQDNYQSRIQDVNLSILTQISSLIELPELDKVTKRKPQGLVEDFYFNYSSQQKWHLWAELEHLSWSEFDDVPGLNNMALELNLTPQVGNLKAHSQNNYIETGNLFTQPLAYDQLDVELELFNRQKGWQIKSKQLWIHNEEISLAAELNLELLATPEMSLYAELNGPAALNAKNYYPNGYMPDGTIDYLNEAIIGGQVELVQLLWQGTFESFPYQDKSGQFAVNAKVIDAEFKFQPDWPTITELDVELNFDRERMDIYSLSGNLINLELGQDVTVSINNLMVSDWLNVDIKNTVSAEKLPYFFSKTPLSDSLGEVLNIVRGKGDVFGETHLKISLDRPEVITTGRVSLNNIPVQITQPGITFENVTGTLEFKDDHINLNNLTANWQGLPVSANIKGAYNNDEYGLKVIGNALWPVKNVLMHGNGLMQGYLAGELPLDLELNIGFPDSGFHYEAKVNSTLKGLTSFLPQPYDKQSEQEKFFYVKVKGDEISNLITASFDEQLFFNGIIDNEKGGMTNAHLVLGNKDLGLNSKDLDVTVNLDQVDMVQWSPFIDHLVTHSGNASGAALLPDLNKITGRVNKVDVSGILFNKLDFELIKFSQSTELKLAAKELRAEISIPTVLAQRPIYIETDYLRIKLSDDTGTTEKTLNSDNSWFANMPAIRFKCEDCRVDDYQLDRVTLDLDPADSGVYISNLIIDKNKHKLLAKGLWQSHGTQLSGQFISQDIGELFDEYEISSAIKDSKADTEFTFNWQGLPYEFNLATLSGEMQWQLGEGHLTEVSDGGSRVFSLLSLDSLVRKLKLDFRDIFSKGFFYNSMQGTLELESGVVHTNNTKMDGVPADVTISGYANLNTKEINYDLAVSPEVTSSLPVIIAWMTANPVAGLAVLALDKVIHSAKVISEIKFKINGTLDKPIVTELGRKSKEIEIPKTAKPVEKTPSDPVNPVNPVK